MIAERVRELEQENTHLRKTLKELTSKIEQGEISKPKSCQYCRNFVSTIGKKRMGGMSLFTLVIVPVGYQLRKAGKRIQHQMILVHILN